MSDCEPVAVDFIDANFCLHYDSGDQINWQKMTDNAKLVRVVVCFGVFLEVERMKNDRQTGKRSRWWVEKLDEAIEADKPIPLREGTTLEFFMAPEYSAINNAVDDEPIRNQALLCKNENDGIPFFFICNDKGSRIAAKKMQKLEQNTFLGSAGRGDSVDSANALPVDGPQTEGRVV